MNRKVLLGTISFILVWSLSSVQVTFAGLVVERVYGKDGVKQVSYFQSNKVKTVSGDNSYVILDLGKGTMTMVEPDKKEYTVTSIKEMVTTMEQGMKQLQDRFKALPPEQRAMVEKMMGIQPASHSSLELKDTGKTQKIAGYTAKKYVILKNGKPIAEYWVSKELRQEILKEMDKSKVDDFEKAMDKLSVEDLPFAGSEAKELAKLEQKIHKYGEVVKEIHYPQSVGEVPRESSEVVSIKKKNLPSSLFQVPAGFKMAESPIKKLGAMPSGPAVR